MTLSALGDLVAQGGLSVSTGDEVGKLVCGTGSIPFIRTSDIANGQNKGDPKHGLSEALYESLADKQNVAPGNILMVRDGTYLVGTCAIVTDLDWKIIYQSHILKFKVLAKSRMDPYLLLALLPSPLVKSQIFTKRFTQDIIDTMGSRWAELVLPMPKDIKRCKEVTNSVKKAIVLRCEASELSWQAVQKVAPKSDGDVALFATRRSTASAS